MLEFKIDILLGNCKKNTIYEVLLGQEVGLVIIEGIENLLFRWI